MGGRDYNFYILGMFILNINYILLSRVNRLLNIHWRLKMITTPSYVNVPLPQHLLKRLTSDAKKANRSLEEQIVHVLEYSEINEAIERFTNFIDNQEKFNEAMLKTLKEIK